MFSRALLPVLGFMWICVLPGISARAGGLENPGIEDESENRWTVESVLNGDYIWAVTRGEAVWGHRLGFLLEAPDCTRKILWLSLTTYEEIDARAEGIVATFDLTAAEARKTIRLPLLSVFDLSKVLFGLAAQSSLRLVAFTNRPLDSELSAFFRAHRRLNLRIVAPEALVKAFDIPEDVFDLGGFAQAEAAALRLCRVPKVMVKVLRRSE
jgi:hypothetical protein